MASDRLCNRFGKLLETIIQQRRRRRRTATRKGLAPEPSSTLNCADQFQNTRLHPNTAIFASSGMPSSEDDSDVPEQVSLSTSKKQVVGRKKDIAGELAKAKLKRKELNRERDRQLKERSLGQSTELISDEEDPSGEDEEPNDPRLLPDHLFTAAFNQQSPAPARPVPKDAAPKIQKKRKRVHLTPKDKIIGRAPLPLPTWEYPADFCSSSRAVRTLSKVSERTVAKYTLPPSSVAKFSSRALNTKGATSLSRIRGWQRKSGGYIQFFITRRPLIRKCS